MQKNYKEILVQILTIINYPNNKEKFFFDFENLNKQEALVNILDRLPSETQEKVKNDPEEMKGVIAQEEYDQELLKVSEDALAKFIEDIYSTLSTKQIDQIEKLLNLELLQDPN
ncbi:MAG: hypothetical protein ACREHC_00080 [Candidatus Levyibacteriota bacterium]